MMIHTNELKDVPWMPYFVSPKHHIKHHEEKTQNYAAPLVNIDQLEKELNELKELDWDVITI